MIRFMDLLFVVEDGQWIETSLSTGARLIMPVERAREALTENAGTKRRSAYERAKTWAGIAAIEVWDARNGRARWIKPMCPPSVDKSAEVV